MRHAWSVLLLAGCSLVNDPSAHMNGTVDAGFDAGVDAGTDAGPPPIDALDFCPALAAMICEAYDSCCSMAPADLDIEMCVEMMSTNCVNSYSPILFDRASGYDAAEAGRVLEEGYAFLRGENGNERCDTDAAPWLANRDGLLRIMRGSLTGGEACTPMTLVPFDYAALFSCENPDLSCIAGNPEWRCVPRLEDGDLNCVLYWDCVDGLRCDYSGPEIAGRCGPRLPNTSPCNTDTDCDSLACEAPSEGAPTVCVPRTPDTVYCEFAPQVAAG
jgi:hypothetical protein